MKMARLPMLALAVAAGAATPRPARAAAGSIRGRVEVTREPPAPDARPTVGDLGLPAAREVHNRRRIVV